MQTSAAEYYFRSVGYAGNVSNQQRIEILFPSTCCWRILFHSTGEFLMIAGFASDMHEKP